MLEKPRHCSPRQITATSLHLYVKRSDHVYHARHAGEDGGIGGLHELRGAGEFRKLRLEFATRISPR
jgi:hypothetical protein